MSGQGLYRSPRRPKRSALPRSRHRRSLSSLRGRASPRRRLRAPRRPRLRSVPGTRRWNPRERRGAARAPLIRVRSRPHRSGSLRYPRCWSRRRHRRRRRVPRSGLGTRTTVFQRPSRSAVERSAPRSAKREWPSIGRTPDNWASCREQRGDGTGRASTSRANSWSCSSTALNGERGGLRRGTQGCRQSGRWSTSRRRASKFGIWAIASTLYRGACGGDSPL